MSKLQGGLPLQATDIASGWDAFYWFLVGVSLFFFLLVVGLLIVFSIKYRSRPGIKTKYITDHHALEIFWTVVPTIILMVIFAWGWSVYKDLVSPPADAMEVRVVGKQWDWTFQYEDGKTTVGNLYVPIHTPVKLIMSSQDVLHSFFVPNFRIKQDVVPGMFTTVWFEATVPGEHRVYCAEYCGGAHSGMLARVIVLAKDQWEDWKRGKQVISAGPASELDVPTLAEKELALASAAVGSGSGSLAEQGKKAYTAKGCTACHTVDGSMKLGPSHKGIYGKEEEMEDGSKVLVDDTYLRESIEAPNAKIVKGFAGVIMPPFKGVLKEEEINALIAYIKSLK